MFGLSDLCWPHLDLRVMESFAPSDQKHVRRPMFFFIIVVVLIGSNSRDERTVIQLGAE
jgi:hypothetical protein